MDTYIKSPMNYSGNKYLVLQQIYSHFPEHINTLVDLFCGGCDVILNAKAKKRYANDVNSHLIEIFKAFQEHSLKYILEYIDKTITTWELSKTNHGAYLEFRSHYNINRNPLDLYILICHSFNYQIRFNSRDEYNNTFGAKRSCFNYIMRSNLMKAYDLFKGIVFSATSFQDFDYDVLKKGDLLYADPPYPVYGDKTLGKRAFSQWTEKDDEALYARLTDCNRKKIRFCLSSFLKYMGVDNSLLKDWIREHKWTVYPITGYHANCNYHIKRDGRETQEVLIVNF